MFSDKIKPEDELLKPHFVKSLKESGAFNRLQDYKQLLQQFNRDFNLYSRSSDSSLDTLFTDSLKGAMALKKAFKAHSPVLDIGSGNGFPGIVCAILYSDIPFVLCERSLKKTEFLKHCAFQLQCFNVTVLHQEAELINKPFARVLSKETGPIKTVLKILKQVLAPQGHAFLWKNPEWKSQWPENTSFFPEVCEMYKIQKERERVLLKVQKKT